MKNFILVYLVISSLSCVQESVLDPTPFPASSAKGSDLIDSELLQYVEQFEAEALSRGLQVDVEGLGITMGLVDIPEDHVAGICFFNSQQDNRIQIDRPTYDRMSDLMREYVVFHELGHCLLGRGHDEAQSDLGICQSIMASGTGMCHVRYNELTRSTLVDELFRADP